MALAQTSNIGYPRFVRMVSAGFQYFGPSVYPPSMARVCPVMNRAASEHSHTTACAKSSALADGSRLTMIHEVENEEQLRHYDAFVKMTVAKLGVKGGIKGWVPLLDAFQRKDEWHSARAIRN